MKSKELVEQLVKDHAADMENRMSEQKKLMVLNEQVKLQQDKYDMQYKEDYLQRE